MKAMAMAEKNIERGSDSDVRSPCSSTASSPFETQDSSEMKHALQEKEEQERERERKRKRKRELQSSFMRLQACYNEKLGVEASQKLKDLKKLRVKFTRTKKLVRELRANIKLSKENLETLLMTKIASVKAQKIKDADRNPTIKVCVSLYNGTEGRVYLPSGVPESALKDDVDYDCKNPEAVLEAVEYVNNVIGPALIGEDATEQATIDHLISKSLDTTLDGKKLCANAVFAVSLAVCRATASIKGVEPCRYIGDLAGNKKLALPVPAINTIHNRVQRENKLAIQEFCFLAAGASSYAEAYYVAMTLYFAAFMDSVKENYMDYKMYIDGVELKIKDTREVLRLMTSAISNSGHTGKVSICVDVAACEFYDSLDKTYLLNSKEKIFGDALKDFYKSLVSEFPILSIDRPFHRDDDREHFSSLTSEIGRNVQVIGDDILVMDSKRLEKAIEEKTCNALLLKINRIRSLTLTDCIKVVNKCKNAGWNIIMTDSGSGQPLDNFIADLSVGLGVDQVRVGVPSYGGPEINYTRLFDIAKLLDPHGAALSRRQMYDAISSGAIYGR